MIQFEAVHKSFRQQPVLRGIDLTIGRGDRVALVGSNGAGKTTLIRCLLGEYHCRGSVRVDGRDPRAERQAVLARIGFVPQLPPALKIPVGQLMRFAAQVCHSDERQIESVAARLGLDLTRVRHQPFSKLSGGQKQKLLISIALGHNADLLILDEPAANLDPAARHTLFTLLAERQHQAAMLISSHRLDEVAALVNRVVELDQGSVVLDDRVADSADLNCLLDCRLRLRRTEEAFARTLGEWGFRADDAGVNWHGTVSGADRLRFHGVLARYAGVLVSIEMNESAGGVLAGAAMGQSAKVSHA